MISLFQVKKLAFALFAVLLPVSILQAAITFTVPSSVDSGQSYTVTAQEPVGGPVPPTLKIYKNGVPVVQNQVYVQYTTTDTGAKTVTWKVTSTYGGSSTKTTTIKATNTPPIGAFDSLTSSVTQGKTISASGWAADNEMGSPITRVDIYLDGVDIANATLGGSRPDVATYYSRSDYTNSGWNWSYNTSSLSIGTHTVAVKYVDDKNAETNGPSKNFTVSSSVPSTTLSAADTTIYTGQSAHLTSVTTDPGSELTTHYMDYLAPGSSTWVLYSPNWASSGNSYWSGSQSSSHTMSVYKTLSTAGTWQFRSRGRDSANRYSSYKYVNVIVTATPPSTSIVASSSSIIQGDGVTITANSSDTFGDLTQVYIDQKQPGGNWEISKYSWSGSARSSYSFPKSLTLSVPGTWQFRARGRDTQGVYGSYSSIKNVAVSSVAPPSSIDTDGDGVDDIIEILFGLNPFGGDATGDLDGDLISNQDEIANGTDPMSDNSWYSPASVPSGAYDGDPIYIVEPDGSGHDLQMGSMTLN